MKTENNDIDVTLRYICSKPFLWFHYGDILKGQRQIYDPDSYGVYLTEEQFEQAGYYVFPAWWFEIVDDNEG